MKVAFCLGLLWAGALSAAAPSPLSQLERVFLYGHEYVRLEDWARANRFQTKWLAPRRELQITGPGCVLRATADARKISLNGVCLWLSTPIVAHHNSALIAPVDLSSSVQPVLSPPKNSAGRKIKTIVLDPGHGGSDPGNQEGKQQEKKYTLLFAKDVSDLLTKAGFKVSLTRATDTTLDLSQRVETAQRHHADLFLSLHFNSADGPGGPAVKGAEVYCMTPARTSSTNDRANRGANASAYPGNRSDSKNMLLAYQLQKALVRGGGLEDRGVHRARFEVLREATMPAALIEAAFMTHPSDARRIYDTAGRRRLARAVAEGVLVYKKLVEQ